MTGCEKAPEAKIAPRIGMRLEAKPAPAITTGGQPTEANLKKAKELGFKTIVNMRTEGENGSLPDEKGLVESLGMRYVSIPVAGAAGVTQENAEALAAVLADSAALPVVVHCASGNRVGAIFAMKAFFLDGKSKEEALSLGKTAGLTGLQAAVEGKLTR